MVESEAGGNTTAHRVAHDAGVLDRQRVEKRTHGIGRDDDVVLVESWLGTEAEARLIEDQHSEVLSQHREVATEVAPTADSRA